MSDYGTCESNLDRIKEMAPLTEREKELARMQFDYKATDFDEDENFKPHPAMIMLFDN